MGGWLRCLISHSVRRTPARIGAPDAGRTTEWAEGGSRPLRPVEETRGQEAPSFGTPVSQTHGRGRAGGGRGVNPDDAFERCLSLLYQAALDDAGWPGATAFVEETVGAGGNGLAVVGELDGDVRLHFARYLRRGESSQAEAQEYYRDYHAHNEMMPRLRRHPHGLLVRVPDLYTEDELKSSPGYNEGMRLLGSRNGLHVRFDGPDGLWIVWGLGDPGRRRGLGSPTDSG